MRAVLGHIRSGITLIVCMFVLTGAIYTGIITGMAWLAFPDKANGSLILNKDGKVIGSELLGQHFTRPEYFWGRPSATTPPYNAAASGSSNLSPNNSKLLKQVRQRSKRLKKMHANDKLIPVDLVTSSASGLDPHISSAAAEYQIQRVAKYRKLPEQRVRELVNLYTEEEFLGYGASRVNVLLLNLSLDSETDNKK